MNRLLYGALVLFIATQEIMAQEMGKYDIADFQYAMVPSVGDVSWSQYHFGGSYVLPTGGQHELGLAASYENTTYSLFNTSLGLDTDSFEEIHLIRAGFFYRIDFSDSWKIGASFSPVISSNLENTLQKEDLQYKGKLTIAKYWGEKTRKVGLKLGLGYGTLYGQPDFYPIVSFVGVTNHWSYNLGYPETSIDYEIGARHRLNLSGKFKGSYANISNEINLPSVFGTTANTKLAYQTIDIGLQHKYRLQAHFTSLFRIGYLTDNQLQLQDGDGLVWNDFNTNGSLYITMGLTFNLNN